GPVLAGRGCAATALGAAPGGARRVLLPRRVGDRGGRPARGAGRHRQIAHALCAAGAQAGAGGGGGGGVACPAARNDAADVLGALPAEERHRYEGHLGDCATCSAAVRELAGLPGLMARLSADRVATLAAGDGAAAPVVPDTLLPALVRRVGRERRRSRLRVGLAAAAVAAAVAAGGILTVQHLTRPAPSRIPPSRTISL